MFKEYIAYVKDNPNRYWFKCKPYGWGWVPVTWQGWLVLAFFLLLILIDAFILDANPDPSAAQITLFFIKEALLIAMLLLFCYKTGEKPKWQWGIKK